MMDTLSSPEMAGRGYVREGMARAADYIEAQLRALGAEPVIDSVQGRHGYRQPYRHPVVRFHEATLSSPTWRRGRAPGLNNRGEAKVGQAWMPLPASGAAFGRYRVVSASSLPQARSLLARTPRWWRSRAMLAPAPVLDSLLALYQVSRDPRQRAAEPRVAWPAPVLIGYADSLPIHSVALEGVSFATLRLQSALARPLLSERRAGVRVALDAEQVAAFEAENVWARIEGTAQPDSVVIVGAHYDHLGQVGEALFAGANDNASGVAMLLNVAASLRARPLRYTALVVAFGSEEAGLIGSQYLVAHAPVDLKRVVMMLNLDLMGSGETGATLVNGSGLPSEMARLTRLNVEGASGHEGPLLARLRPRANAPNSDHYPFVRAGVPALFMYLEGPYREYHNIRDLPGGVTLARFPHTHELILRYLEDVTGTDKGEPKAAPAKELEGKGATSPAAPPGRRPRGALPSGAHPGRAPR